MTFLIVEDDHTTAAFIEKVLADGDQTCLVARDTGEASLLLETTAVDAVVVDLDLSSPLEAFDWLEETVRLRPDFRTRSVILLSEFPRGERAERIRELGMAVLLKPFVSQELRNATAGKNDSSRRSDDRTKPTSSVKPPEDDV